MQDKVKDIEALRKWMVEAGCKIHPALEIPAYFDGVQGMGTNQSIPHKTVILAIPSQLVITVPRCYNDPALKPLFKANDDLFDYQAEEDAEFNILTVFLMYHKLNIETSPWKAYLKTIAKPETAIDWPQQDLVGLNKSLIEEIIHVKRQCKKVEITICAYLKRTKVFGGITDEALLQLFRTCYPSVLTRCFGYYFSTACLIPIADLMNHSCHSIDHQLVHTNFQRGLEFHENYVERSRKIDCQLLGLPEPKPEKRTFPARLQFLIKNNLVENDLEVLNKLKKKDIDEKIFKFLEAKFKEQDVNVAQMDFCEEDDEEDNDTDEEDGAGSQMNLQRIQEEERQQLALFKQHFDDVKVQRYADVEKRIKLEFGDEDQTECTPQKKQTSPNICMGKQQNIGAENISQSLNDTENETNKNKNRQEKQNTDINSTCSSSTLQMKHEQQKIVQKLPPIEHVESSSSEEECSQEEEWCLDKTCYFSISTDSPVEAGAQLFNSYGSRTNRFLMVWYGFTYPNNLYDSVTLRLQALFSEKRPPAKDIVLDTYVGGQGLVFKKNEEEVVRPEQVSKEFKFKRTRLPRNLIIFLRLYLINFYQGDDTYKNFVTFPSSFKFQIQLLMYLKDIVQSIYSRYELATIEKLKQHYHSPNTDPQVKIRTNYKIIYLQEQRKILDQNLKGISVAIKVMKRLQKCQIFTKEVFQGVSIEMMRYIRDYMMEIQHNFGLILYQRPKTKVENKMKEEDRINEGDRMKMQGQDKI